jgi:hypothetical protein
MRKIILVAIMTVTLFSCSKNKNDEQIVLLIKERSILMDNQSLEMKNRITYLQEQNNYIYDMTTAGATQNEIKKIENEKENNLEKFKKRLNDIEIKMDINFKKQDSITKLLNK